MSDLTDFLLARIAEDEAVAREAQPGAWQLVRGDIVGSSGETIAGGDYHSFTDPDTAAHIARHDPARVLAECAAKRDLIRVCTAELSGRDIEGAMSDGDDGPWLADHVLHTLASIYADHPDYQEAWRD